MKQRAQSAVLMLGLLVSALLAGPWVSAQNKDEPKFGRPHIEAVTGPARVLENAKIVDFGDVIYKGPVDVNPTLERIRMGRSLRHRNDGSIFQNREGRLPRNRDTEYYREFVMQMKGVPFPGPTRVIIGLKGEVFFTGDHYSSFTRVR